MWEGVEDRTELQHIDPDSYGHISVSFPFSWAAQPGTWGPNLSGTWSLFQHLLCNSSEHELLNRGSWGPPLLGAGYRYSILSPTNSNFPCTELYYCFTPTQFNLSTFKVISLIPSTGCTCYLHRCISYFDSSAWVSMQHRLHTQVIVSELIQNVRTQIFHFGFSLFSFLLLL